jgi:hypothetical protein
MLFYLPNRTVRQIREIYKNYLYKSVDFSPFSKDENDKMIRLVAEKGNNRVELQTPFLKGQM